MLFIAIAVVVPFFAVVLGVILVHHWTDSTVYRHNNKELKRAQIVASNLTEEGCSHQRASARTAPERALLVFAHPDDEAMFFTPLLLELRRLNFSVSFLCLSTGNAAGLGEVRRQELVRSAKYFLSQCGDGCEKAITEREAAAAVTIIDHEVMQDGMTNTWDIDVVRRFVVNEVELRNATLVFSFDAMGVSSHANHKAVFEGVRHAARAAAQRGIASVKFFTLATRPMCLKYTSVFSLLEYVWGNSSRSDASAFFSILVPRSKCGACRRALQCHASQFVWFRWLFVLFASYSFVNELEELRP